jgi:hypothetical protein
MLMSPHLTARGGAYSRSLLGQAWGNPHIYSHTGDDLRVAFLCLFTLDASVTDNGSRFDVPGHFKKFHGEEYRARFTRIITRNHQGRSLCFSRHSRIGLVPDDAKAGDLICLLLGGLGTIYPASGWGKVHLYRRVLFPRSHERRRPCGGKKDGRIHLRRGRYFMARTMA